MAERHYERGRQYPEDYRHRENRRESGESRDRGFFDRAGDEVRSWFGDEDAEQRRTRDEGRDRQEDGVRRNVAWPGERWDRVPDERYGPRRSETYGSPRRERESWPDEYRRSREDSGRSAYEGSRRGGEDYERPRSGWSGGWRDPSEGVGGIGAGWGAGPAGWAAAPGAGQYRGLGPRGYRRSDDRIREDVCDRLTDDPSVDASDVEVEVKDGEVVLSGSVNGREQKRRMEDLVERITGVRDVSNRLRTSRTGGESGGGIGHQESGQPGSVLGTRDTKTR